MRKKIIMWLLILVPIAAAALGLHFYTRSLEKKADAIVIDFTYKPGFNPAALQEFADLRWATTASLRKLATADLKDKYDVLMTCSFDTKTPWPAAERMPENFNPVEIMALGQDPGLGIRELHKQGITGKGVSIAIIGEYPRLDHEDYRAKIAACRLASGEAVPPERMPTLQGTELAGLLVGDKCGTAPGATLSLWVTEDGTGGYRGEIAALERILESNLQSDPASRIRVVSISKGLAESYEGYQEFAALLAKAAESGLFVVLVDGTIEGVGCPPDKDRNDANNYTPPVYIKAELMPKDILFFPSEFRTTASDIGPAEYAYTASAGVGWAIPYAAGVAALALQVKPGLKPQEIKQLMIETGTPFHNGRLINPKALIDKLKSL